MTNGGNPFSPRTWLINSKARRSSLVARKDVKDDEVEEAVALREAAEAEEVGADSVADKEAPDSDMNMRGRVAAIFCDV